MNDRTESATSARLRRAWDSYHRALDEIRAEMEATPRYREYPRCRASAYHALMEVQAMAYNFIVQAKMTNPRIFKNLSWNSDIYTLGQNGPDFDYRNLFVDGAQTYRLTGRIGGSRITLLQVFNGVFSDPGVRTVGNYDLVDFDTTPDGRFEIVLGGPERDGNWIPLDPHSGYQFVFIRRAIADWHDDPGELAVERISPLTPGHYDADAFDEAAIADRIERAENFVRYVTRVYNIDLYDNYSNGAHGVNGLSLRPGTTDGEVGSPSSNYALGTYKVADDEALVIAMDRLPDGVYWSFQLGDVWSRTLSFHERQSSLNMTQILPDADGGLHVVIATRDPGVANWLDSCGRNDGTIVFRNYRSRTTSVPTVRLVKLADLAAALPKGFPTVTPEARAATLAHRRAGFIKYHGE